MGESGMFLAMMQGSRRAYEYFKEKMAVWLPQNITVVVMPGNYWCCEKVILGHLAAALCNQPRKNRKLIIECSENENKYQADQVENQDIVIFTGMVSEIKKYKNEAENLLKLGANSVAVYALAQQ